MPPFHGFLPQEASSLTASTHLALTFLTLGAGLPNIGEHLSRFSFVIKAQCSGGIYSTGERESKGEGKKTAPFSSTPLLFTQRDIWEEVTGSCGSRHFLLWDKLEGHGCHFV